MSTSAIAEQIVKTTLQLGNLESSLERAKDGSVVPSKEECDNFMNTLEKIRSQTNAIADNMKGINGVEKTLLDSQVVCLQDKLKEYAGLSQTIATASATCREIPAMEGLQTALASKVSAFRTQLDSGRSVERSPSQPTSLDQNDQAQLGALQTRIDQLKSSQQTMQLPWVTPLTERFDQLNLKLEQIKAEVKRIHEGFNKRNALLRLYQLSALQFEEQTEFGDMDTPLGVSEDVGAEVFSVIEKECPELWQALLRQVELFGGDFQKPADRLPLLGRAIAEVFKLEKHAAHLPQNLSLSFRNHRSAEAGLNQLVSRIDLGRVRYEANEIKRMLEILEKLPCDLLEGKLGIYDLYFLLIPGDKDLTLREKKLGNDMDPLQLYQAIDLSFRLKKVTSHVLPPLLEIQRFSSEHNIEEGWSLSRLIALRNAYAASGRVFNFINDYRVKKAQMENFVETAMGLTNVDQIGKCLDEVPQSIRKQLFSSIYSAVYFLSDHRDPNQLQWGEWHVADDLTIFKQAAQIGSEIFFSETKGFSFLKLNFEGEVRLQ